MGILTKPIFIVALSLSPVHMVRFSTFACCFDNYWRKYLSGIWRKLRGMQELVELSAEGRDLAMSRFHLL
jgi:hypothetical protein